MKKKKLLVLGSSSFGGSSFVNFMLSKNNYKIYGTYNTNKTNLYLPYTDNKNLKNFTNFKLDLSKKKNNLIKIIKKIQPNYIVDFASANVVNPSWSNPKMYNQINVSSKIELIKNLNKFVFLKKFVYISTPEIFGSSKNKLLENSKFFNPSTPYASSKLSIELLLKNYQKFFNAPVIIARFSNFYGPGQSLNRLIPKAIFCINNKKKFPLEGKGDAIRGYIFSHDFCNGIFKILKKGKIGNIFHFSEDKYYSVLETIKIICKIKNYPIAELILTKKDRTGRDHCYKLNTSKAKKLLGWKNKYSLKNGLIETIKFFQKKY
jgi:dTDP-glucose 4,6-dehydratase